MLIESGDYRSISRGSRQIPNILREIGRLREIAFRGVGEGTGRSLDLDRFDAALPASVDLESENAAKWWARIGWRERIRSKRARAIFIPARCSVFVRACWKHSIRRSNSAAPSCGRSISESYVALLLLWKRNRSLRGAESAISRAVRPVSISREYNRASRTLMVSYLERPPRQASAGRPGRAQAKGFRTNRRRRMRPGTARLPGRRRRGALRRGRRSGTGRQRRAGAGAPVSERRRAILAFNVDAGFRTWSTAW